MTLNKIFLKFILASFLSLASVQAKVHYHRWDITYQYKSPDCFNKLAITINGQTPGPTIYASQGDTIVVEIKNSLLTENTAIHWHGIRQIGAPWMDGVQAKVHHQKWEISYQFKSPDCLKKLAVTINGQTPGPTIYGTEGDTVVIEAKNNLLTENVAIHWHSIRQIGTPWMDGTEGVTQCPILPGDTFIYRFVVDQAGTYIYHAHYGMQRSAGLNGMIIVTVPDGFKEPFTYDRELSILLNDWWHNSTYEQAAGLALPGKQITWVGEPHSLLINGRGKFNCSLAVDGTCNATNPECAPYMLTVVPGKTYCLRIASVTSLSALNFEIEGHSLTMVETDGHYVDPFVVKNLNIYSGETYSVILKADQDPTRNYWLASNVVNRKLGTPTGTGILHYYGVPRGRLPTTAPPIGPLWNDTLYRFNQSVAIHAHLSSIDPPPSKSDQVITLLNTQNRVNGVKIKRKLETKLRSMEGAELIFFLIRWFMWSWFQAHRAMIDWQDDQENPRAVALLGSWLIFLGGFNLAAIVCAGFIMTPPERTIHGQPTVMLVILAVVFAYLVASAFVALGIGLYLMVNPNPRRARRHLVTVTWWAVNFATPLSLGLGVTVACF